jgi:chromosome segregation ATPase
MARGFTFALVMAAAFFLERGSVASSEAELAESESWEHIAKSEIEARAEDKRKAVDHFAEAELERVRKQHAVESKMAKKYETVLAELEEAKTEIDDKNNQLEEVSAHLANSVSDAKAAQTSLLEEQQSHNRDLNSWRHAAQDVLLKVKTRFQQSPKHLGSTKAALKTPSISLLDAGDHAQTPEQFTSATTSLLDAAESTRRLALKKEKAEKDQAKQAKQQYLRSNNGGLDMTHDAVFERQLESYVPGQSPLPGVDTSTGPWSQPVKNPTLAAKFPDIPAFQ